MAWWGNWTGDGEKDLIFCSPTCSKMNISGHPVDNDHFIASLVPPSLRIRHGNTTPLISITSKKHRVLSCCDVPELQFGFLRNVSVVLIMTCQLFAAKLLLLANIRKISPSSCLWSAGSRSNNAMWCRAWSTVVQLISNHRIIVS